MIDDDDNDLTPPPMVKSSDHARSLRVNLAKKLHERKAPFETSVAFSPIPKPKGKTETMDSTPQAAPTGSTPRRGILKVAASTSMKRQVTFDEDSATGMSLGDKKLCSDDDESIFYEPEEPTYTGLSYVKMVEEDYLHFLSNLFSVICQSEN